MTEDLKKRIWWDYLDKDLQELIRESTLLIDRVGDWKETFHDYAFVVFPAAKAYEGFLKNLFLDLGFISSGDFYGKRFRVGKALNPTLDRRFRKKEGVYDKIVNYCGGKELADTLWDTWRKCRNVLFHWFPNENNSINFSEAKERVKMILTTMNEAFKQCNIDINEKKV
jgi:hypothetical protein